MSSVPGAPSGGPGGDAGLMEMEEPSCPWEEVVLNSKRRATAVCHYDSTTYFAQWRPNTIGLLKFLA